MQVIDAYDKTVPNASSVSAAEIQIVAFARLIILKLTELFPNLKDDFFEPFLGERQRERDRDRDQ